MKHKEKMQNTIIQYDKVQKAYRFGEKERVVLDKLSLDIYKGEYVWITGKSGSGKSTLLNVLTGIDYPDGGRISVNQETISKMTEEEMSKWRGKNIGIVFQFFQLIPTLSVLENLLLVMDLVRIIPKNERLERAEKLLATVGLENHKDKLPSMLSGGEQQRVAIARALANDADIIVADEPTGNLDIKNSQMIYSLFKELNEQGKTIVMVTHERELQDGVTRCIVLQDGRIIEDVNLMESEVDGIAASY